MPSSLGTFNRVTPSLRRRVAMEVYDAMPPGHMMFGLVDVDVTDATAWVQAQRDDGVRVSLVAVWLRALAVALAEHPELNAIRDGNQVVVFDDVDVNLPVERHTAEGDFPHSVVVRRAQDKSAVDIYGDIEAAIASLYVVFLGIIGGLMFWESLSALLKSTGGGDPKRRRALRAWTRILPFKRRFPRSGLYISFIPPILIGFFVGFIAAVLGIGGGFILAPAMVYLLGIPTRVMVGTSLFQIIFLTAFVTFLQATINQTVDLVLAAVLMVGGVVGARLGAKAGQHLNAAQLRFLLALVILAMGGKLAFDLFFGEVSEFHLEALH